MWKGVHFNFLLNFTVLLTYSDLKILGFNFVIHDALSAAKANITSEYVNCSPSSSLELLIEIIKQDSTE